MAGWDFDGAGSFGSEKAAGDYAKRNGIDVRDIQTRRKGEGVELEIRRSAIDGRTLRDGGEGHQSRRASD